MFFNKYPYTDFHELNLDFLLKNYKGLLDDLATLDSWVETHQQEYDELKAIVDQIVAGQFPPEAYDAIASWIRRNALSIVASCVQFMWFSLDDNGNFVIAIPENWKFLKFNTTGYDIVVDSCPEFGHLTLTY